MASAPEAYLNFQKNNITEFIINLPYSLSISTNNESVSVSVSTLKTSNESKKDQIKLVKKKIIEKHRSLTPKKQFSNKFVLFKENNCSVSKNKSALNLMYFKEKNNNSENNKNSKKTNEIDKNIKNLIDKKQETKKLINDYCQTYDRSDFAEQPPSVSVLFLHDYNYKNEKNFVSVNNTVGKISGASKIPNVFYNHLMVTKNIKNVNNKEISSCCTSVTKRCKEKLLSIIYYSPGL